MKEKTRESAHVEIILLNYRGCDYTLELLENLKEVEYDDYGVIVIENGSGDDSHDRLKAVENSYPEWTFIFNSENKGFSGGCNQGIEIALEKETDYVLLLNNDTKVSRGFLEPLVNLSQKRNALTGGVIYYDSHGIERIWSYGGCITWGAVPGHLELMGKRILSKELPIEKKTGFIPGCCLMIPRGVIEKIGLLDEDYFAYVEDVDYCLRAEEAGFPSYVTSLSMIHHKVGQSTGGGYSPGGRRLIAESSVVFIRKHGDFLKRFKFVTLFWLGIIVATIREGICGNFDAVREKIQGYHAGWLKTLNQPRKLD